MPEDYILTVYNGMKQAYASTGFKLSEDEFRNKLTSDPAYASTVYDGMNSAFFSLWFKLTKDEFASRLGGPKKKEPTIPSSGSTPSEVPITHGVQPSTPGVQQSQGSGTLGSTPLTQKPTPISSSLQGLQDVLVQTGKGFTGTSAEAPRGLSGRLSEGDRPVPLTGLTSGQPLASEGVETFGQAGKAFFSPETIDYIKRDSEFSTEKISELELARDNELSLAGEKDKRFIENRYNSLIEKEQNKINENNASLESAGFSLSGQDPNAPEEEKSEEELEIESLEASRGVRPAGSELKSGLSDIVFNPKTGGLEDLQQKKVDFLRSQRTDAKIAGFKNFVDKDINDWARSVKDEITESEFEDVKSFQDFAKGVFDDDNMSDFEKSTAIDKEFTRLESKMKESAMDKALKSEAAATNRDVSDVMYDKQKDVSEWAIDALPDEMREMTQDVRWSN